jgi:hypothetical protein
VSVDVHGPMAGLVHDVHGVVAGPGHTIAPLSNIRSSARERHDNGPRDCNQSSCASTTLSTPPPLGAPLPTVDALVLGCPIVD